MSTHFQGCPCYGAAGFLDHSCNGTLRLRGKRTHYSRKHQPPGFSNCRTYIKSQNDKYPLSVLSKIIILCSKVCLFCLFSPNEVGLSMGWALYISLSSRKICFIFPSTWPCISRSSFHVITLELRAGGSLIWELSCLWKVVLCLPLICKICKILVWAVNSVILCWIFTISFQSRFCGGNSYKFTAT